MSKTKPFKPDPELVYRRAVDFQAGFHMSSPSWHGTTVEAVPCCWKYPHTHAHCGVDHQEERMVSGRQGCGVIVDQRSGPDLMG